MLRLRINVLCNNEMRMSFGTYILVSCAAKTKHIPIVVWACGLINIKASDPVTVNKGSGVRFPAVTMSKIPAQVSHPVVPLCVIIKYDRVQSINK